MPEGSRARAPRSSSVNSLPLIIDIEDFKGDFSFDALFANLVNDLLPSFLEEEEADSGDGHGNIDSLANGQNDASRMSRISSASSFPEVDGLLSLFKDACKELVDLRKHVDGRLNTLKKEVSSQDDKHLGQGLKGEIVKMVKVL